MVFIPHNLKLFFNNVKTLYNRPEVSLEMIWNLYETGANTADIFHVRTYQCTVISPKHWFRR